MSRTARFSTIMTVFALAIALGGEARAQFGGRGGIGGGGRGGFGGGSRGGGRRGSRAPAFQLTKRAPSLSPLAAGALPPRSVSSSPVKRDATGAAILGVEETRRSPSHYTSSSRSPTSSLSASSISSLAAAPRDEPIPPPPSLRRLPTGTTAATPKTPSVAPPRIAGDR